MCVNKQCIKRTASCDLRSAICELGEPANKDRAVCPTNLALVAKWKPFFKLKSRAPLDPD